MNMAVALSRGRIGLVVNSRTHGEHCIIIDAQDYELVSQYRWHVDRQGYSFYALTRTRKADGVPTNMKLHRLLVPGAPVVDHIDRNGLNNTRANLRPATKAENGRNTRVHRHNTSGFRGVSWRKERAKWQSQIWIDGKKCHLGYFSTPEDSARAFDAAAREIGYSESSLNFPEDSL